MSNDPKRYIFIDFENLKKIKVKKLQSVCCKFFILINDSNKTIPFSIVTKIQKLGNRVKWIPVDTQGSHNLNYHIAFLIGKMHQKSNPDTEFVVLSNNTEIDPLIAFINEDGRFCIRVRRANKTVPRSGSTQQSGSNNSSSDNSNGHDIGTEERKKRLDILINDSKSRLLIIGDRPAQVHDLCKFLSLHNQEYAPLFEMSEILGEMQKRKDIQLNNKQVKYNF